LAIQEPRIESRLPGLEIVSQTSVISVPYHPKDSGHPIDVKGERVTIRLDQGQKTLVEASWSSRLPDVLPPGSGLDRADVNAEDLLKKLFRLRVFTQKDLVELVHSNLPEVRIGAAANLTDQSVLSEVASDSNSLARTTAVNNLIDQAIHKSTGKAQIGNSPLSAFADQYPSVLLKLVMEAKDSSVAVAVAERLTDQSALARVAIEHKDSLVRQTAVKKLTDQSLLAKLATQDDEPQVRSAAVQRVFDQSLLATLATQDHEPQVRSAAVGNNNLTDQSLLVKIATQDPEAQVRSIAVGKVTDQSALSRLAARDVDQQVRECARLRLQLLRKMEAAGHGR